MNLNFFSFASLSISLVKLSFNSLNKYAILAIYFIVLKHGINQNDALTIIFWVVYNFIKWNTIFVI